MSINHHFYGMSVAKVENAGRRGPKDPNKQGRVQIRPFGIHDDISMKDLFWGFPMHYVSSAGHAGVGTAPLGCKEDSIVCIQWLDPHKTIPMITGVLSRSGETSSGSDAPEGDVAKIDQSKNDLPHNSREKDLDIPIKKPVIDRGIQGAKFPDQKTLAAYPFKGERLLQHVKQIDPGNISGVLKPAIEKLEGMKKILDAVQKKQPFEIAMATIKKLNIEFDPINGFSKAFGGMEAMMKGMLGQFAGQLGNLAPMMQQMAMQQIYNAMGSTPIGGALNNVLGASSNLAGITGILGSGGANLISQMAPALAGQMANLSIPIPAIGAISPTNLAPMLNMGTSVIPGVLSNVNDAMKIMSADMIFDTFNDVTHGRIPDGIMNNMVSKMVDLNNLDQLDIKNFDNIMKTIGQQVEIFPANQDLLKEMLFGDTEPLLRQQLDEFKVVIADPFRSAPQVINNVIKNDKLINELKDIFQ